MMTQQNALMIWDHLRQMQGIALRLIDQLPAEEFDAHPVRNMRTPKELIVHMYLTSVKAVTEGIISGEIAETEETVEPQVCASIKTKSDLVKFVNDCWSKATQAIEKATDAQLGAMVKTPWRGMSLPGFACVSITHDEFTHHRGQLYAYVRALGHDVPQMWDFSNNAPEYQPKAHAGA